MTIRIPVSIGELVDKLTILEIKKFKITEQEKKSKIIKEYGLLQEVILESEVSKNIEYQQFYNNLKKINQELWEIEDQIRIFEKDKNFGLEFVDLARSVYRLNDKRFEIKNEINIFFGSEIAEQKEYEEY
tara:strand:+ start:533 stop:922 length:390 start_codon:yes stop_codon:yes gene_type:complete